MSNGRKVERYTYRLVGEVRLATPAGEFETMHFERVVESARESKAEVWLAKDRFNFPVRVVFDVRPHGFIALRDYAMVYYAAFFFIAQYAAARG